MMPAVKSRRYDMANRARQAEDTRRRIVDPAVAPLLRDKERFRYEDQARVVRSLRRQRRLRPGLSDRKAADIIWALASEHLYLALVRDRGWSANQYEELLAQQLAAALLPP